MALTESREQFELANIGPGSLGGWFAEPLSHDQARALRASAHRRLQRAYATGGDGFAGQVQELVAAFWLDGAVEHRYAVLARAANGWQAALLELIHGQLLASRGMHPAPAHLDAGFAAAKGFLSAGDYFRVMRRHDLLRLLPVSLQPGPARTLDELLLQARVIKRLRGHHAQSVEIRDTGSDIAG